MSAEAAYLFRHALLRDAAYQLQLSGDRARLHRLAFELIEDMCGGRSPEPPPLDSPQFQAHATDPFALDLARHARAALSAGAGEERSATSPSVLPLYLRRADLASRHFRPEAAEYWRELAEMLHGAARASALQRAGFEAGQTGRSEMAATLLEAALAESQIAGDRHGEGKAPGALAAQHQEHGDLDLALEMFRRAIDIFRESGDRRGEAIALTNLAGLLRETGRTTESEQACTRALRAHHEVGNREGEGMALSHLAALHFTAGRPEEARIVLEKALSLQRAVGNR